MFPSDYGRTVQALAELMKEQGDWTPEVEFFARYFCKAAGIRATLPPIEMIKHDADVPPRNKGELEDGE